MVAEADTAAPAPSRALPAAWVIQLGLVVVAGAALAGKQAPELEKTQIGGLVLVGLALILWALLERRRAGVSVGLRLLIGLGAAMLWGLAHALRLPGETAARLHLGVGTLGVALAFVGWLWYYAAGGENGQRPAPLRRAAVVAGGLIVMLALAIQLALLNMYGSLGDFGTSRVIVEALQFMGLMAAVLGSAGGPGVRRAPAYYLGAALLAAAALNFLATQGGGA